MLRVLQATGRTTDMAHGPSPPPVATATQSTGLPLDEPARLDMEERYREDFTAVRVHVDQGAASSAEALHAHAYTVGDHVVFNRGQYAPHGAAGRRLLAHELAHVVQQRRPAGAFAGSQQAERDAHDAAHQVASGGTPSVRERAAPGVVQRQEKQGSLPPDLPRALLENLKKMGLITDAPAGPVVAGNIDPALLAAAIEALKSGKRPRVDPNQIDFLKIPLLPGPGAPPLDLTAPVPAIGLSLSPPANLKPAAPPPKSASLPKAQPKAEPPAATTPDLVSVEGSRVTQAQLSGLAGDTLLAEMGKTLDWLRANKVSSKRADEVGRYYSALCAIYREQKDEIELHRRVSGRSRSPDQQLADVEAVLAVKSELAARFPSIADPWEVPIQTLKAEDSPGDLQATGPGLTLWNIGSEGGDEGTIFGATSRNLDPRYLDNFTRLSVDSLSQEHDYVAWFPDGTTVSIPRALIDAKDADGSYSINEPGGVREFVPKDSKSAPVLLPPRLDKASLPRLFETIKENREVFDTGELLTLAGRNVITHESMGQSGDTLDKVMFALMLLRAGTQAAYGVRGGGRPGGGEEGPDLPRPNRVPGLDLSDTAATDLEALYGGRGPGPGNDVFLLPEPLARTGTGDFHYPQPAPRLRLLPTPQAGEQPFFVPYDQPVAVAGGGKGGGDFLGPSIYTGWPALDVSSTRLGAGGGWSAQSLRGRTIKFKQELLDQQVTAEIDRINNRRSEISADEWKDQRAGLTKRLYNLREEQHALQIAQAEPGALVLTQVEVLGVSQGGTFTATEDIAGSGRIPDVGVLKPKGKLTLIDSKTQNEVLNSIKRRGSGLRPSSAIGKQVAKEQALKTFGGDWVLQGTDPVTGEVFTFTMSPAEVEVSRPVPYGQHND
jgi:hypothetical protein